jgi:tRNA-2-methylthio-N6-dimethylallyladenosine synthase
MNEIFIKPDLKNAQRRSKDETIIDRSLFNIPDEYKQLGYNKKYYLRTYGCQANERDSETIRGILELMSYIEVKEPEFADIIIMNTCAIRKNAENHVFGEIGQLKRLKYINPDLMFVVCGCMAQEEEVVETILKKYHHIDIIFGTHNIHRFPELLIQAHFNKERVVEVYSKEGEIYENLPVIRQQNTKAWVNIIYGCDKFCTYCIVPYTRGKERSRLKEDILDEINSLIKDGYKEVTLLGQNVNAYGKDLADDYLFAELLEDVAKTNIERIRFMTSHPWDFTDKMVDIIAKYDNIMPFVHLPLQSGNNDILKLMGRRYTTDDYLHVFNRLKERVKNISFSTDIIVGFPNESEEQFEDTLKIMDYCQFDNVYTFIYSPRSGTPASRMEDNVNLETKRNRLKLLNQKVAQYALQNNKKLVGSIQKVLVDGPSKRDVNVYSGYTEGNKLVNFIPKNAKTGMIVQVKITNVNTWTLKGDEISI